MGRVIPMNRYLVSGAVVATPVLVCMAAVIYILSPPSDGVAPQSQVNAVRAEAPAVAPARSAPRSDGDGSWLTRISKAVIPSIGWTSAPPRSATTTVEAAPALSEAEQAAQWEALVDSETSDLQTRGEALVNLTQADAVRGESVLGAMLASGETENRLMAVAQLRDWRNRTGDPDGRIAGLLMQAASDPDEGVAYQARAALEPAENYQQVDAGTLTGESTYDSYDYSGAGGE